jgi:aquaporin related protein
MSLSRTRIIQLSTIFFAEFFGTAIMVFVACFGGINGYEHFKPTLATMSVCSGLAPMIVINIFGHISGAHINPAVTVAAFISKLIDIPVR